MSAGPTTRFAGLSAFPITPVREDGAVETDALQQLVARLVSAGVDSIGLLGSTGSYAYLSRAERLRAIEAARVCAGGRPLLVGIGALRTDEAIRLASDAQAAGAQAGLLAAMSYAPLTEDEVFEHVRAVAGVGLPLCLYDNPATTRFAFTPALIGRLVEVPGVVALKTPAVADGVGGQLAGLRAMVPGGFSVGFSVDWYASEALLAGGDVWYSVLAGLYPGVCLRLVRAAQGGKADEVRRLNRWLEPVWELFRRYSSYRVMHLAASLLGIAQARPSRPVLPLSGEAAGEVERVLERAGLD